MKTLLILISCISINYFAWSQKIVVTETIETHPYKFAEFESEYSYLPAPLSKELTDSFATVINRRKLELISMKQPVDSKSMSYDTVIQRIDREKRSALLQSYLGYKAHYPQLTIQNKWLKLKILPTYAMRMLNVTDLRTNTSLSGSPENDDCEKLPFIDIFPWTAGISEFSFPYPSQGSRIQQPAGYRSYRAKDSSFVLVSDMRFSHFQNLRDTAAYGRYAQEILQTYTTVYPNQSGYKTTYHLENPNPTTCGSRLWVSYTMFAKSFDNIVFPAGYIIDDNTTSLLPFWAENNLPKTDIKILNNLYPEYGFVANYQQEKDINNIVVFDPKTTTGCRLNTTNISNGLIEISLGTSPILAHPGEKLNAFETKQSSIYQYQASGIGKLVYANEYFAIGEKEGNLLFISPKSGTITVKDAMGKILVNGAVSPNSKPLSSVKNSKLKIYFNQQLKADITYPLSYEKRDEKFAQLKKYMAQPDYELEQIMYRPSTALGTSALNAIKKLEIIVQSGKNTENDCLECLCFVAYKYGYFDLAKKGLTALPDSPQKKYLIALINWEEGKDADFTGSVIEGNYFKAMQEIKKGNKVLAIKYLEDFVKEKPNVLRPKLMLAFLKDDKKTAQSLTEKFPASPEAQVVAALLKIKGSYNNLTDLIRDNPDCEKQITDFNKEINNGEWKHSRRFLAIVPK